VEPSGDLGVFLSGEVEEGGGISGSNKISTCIFSLVYIPLPALDKRIISFEGKEK